MPSSWFAVTVFPEIVLYEEALRLMPSQLFVMLFPEIVLLYEDDSRRMPNSWFVVIAFPEIVLSEEA